MQRRLFLLAPLLPRKRTSKRKPVIESLHPAERRQLLRGFPDTAIAQELDRRLLSLFSLEELQAEAERRGLR